MFESDEFDVDEDFLKDVDEKVEEYFSQRNDTDSEPSPKRHKLNDPQSDLSDINFDDEPDFARNAGKIVETRSNELDVVRLSVHETMLTKDEASVIASVDKNVEERKTLALEILRRGASKENSVSMSLWREPSQSQQRSFREDRNSKKLDLPWKIDEKNNVDTFKKPVPRWIKSTTKSVARESEKYRALPPRMTLVRKFPGPAGLLPDSPDLDANNAIFLNRLDEHKIDTSENLDDSSMSEYCSQNTERMFSVGAWRSMLDDLPPDFLKGHEIATIKRRARNNCGSCENSRASFLAGVVQRVDHSLENPRLALKDLGDSIEATMHRDICLAHPNVIEPGVVLLLRDVGLLGFQGSQKCLGTQFHVIIAPKNLLAVYSEKSRLITSPWMQSLLGEATKTFDNKAMTNESERDDDETAFATVDIGAISDSQIAATFSNITPDIAKNKNKKSESKPIDESSKLLKMLKTSENIRENIEIRPKSVKSKLLQYVSKDVLTPPVADADNKSTQLSKDDDDVTNIGTFADNLLDSDNDTEDEILSQLDMDSIVTNYNSRT